jgi:hypothetical protein
MQHEWKWKGQPLLRYFLEHPDEFLGRLVYSVSTPLIYDDDESVDLEVVPPVRPDDE